MFRFIPQLLNLLVNFSDVCNISMTFHQTVLFFVEKLTNFARIEGGPRLLPRVCDLAEISRKNYEDMLANN